MGRVSFSACINLWNAISFRQEQMNRKYFIGILAFAGLDINYLFNIYLYIPLYNDNDMRFG